MMNAINISNDDRKQYRKSLMAVIQAALLNQRSLLNGFPSGSEISDCLDIVTLLGFEGEPEHES